MSWESWAVVVQAIGTVIAAVAIIISYRALRDARAKAGDIEGGMHSIAYREHVWNLHRWGLQVDEIEEVMRQETYRPGIPLAEANAYDDGYAPDVGSVRKLLDPLERKGADLI